MKEKILAFLKGKLSGVSTTFLDGVAESYSKTITEEAQIETVISDGVISSLKFSAQFAQTEGDKRATEASNTALKNFRDKHKLDENGKPIETPAPKPDDKNVPEWAKGLMEKVDKVVTTQESITKSQTSAQTLETVKAKLKEKGVPDEFLDDYATTANLEAEDLNVEIETAFGKYDKLQKSVTAKVVKDGNYTPSSGSPSEESTTNTIKEWKPE